MDSSVSDSLRSAPWETSGVQSNGHDIRQRQPQPGPAGSSGGHIPQCKRAKLSSRSWNHQSTARGSPGRGVMPRQALLILQQVAIVNSFVFLFFFQRVCCYCIETHLISVG